MQFWKFIDFLKTFRSLDPPWNTGQKNFRKNYPITCSKHVWTLFGRILSFFGFLKFFDFLKTFRGLDPTWNTGQKNFFLEKLPQNMFKTRLAILGTISGIYGFLKIFWFKNISKTRPSMEHWAKNFLSKILTENMFKTRLDNFGNDFGHFCNFENFLIFWKHFEDSTLHGTLGKKNFRKNYPKTCSKRVWTLLGTILGILDNLKLFWFFENISKTRPSMEHWGNFFFENINPKHVQNTFGHFWERFRDFCNFENLLILWKHFEVSTLHGTLGKNFFSKSTPKHVQNAFGQFGNDFGRFCNFDIF